MRTSSLLILLTLFSQAGEAQILRWRTMQRDRTAAPAQLISPGPRLTLLRSHLLVQFPQRITPDQISALGRRGIQALAYVPDNGLVVSAPDGIDFSSLGLRWYGRLLPSEKLSPGVLEISLLAQPWVVVEFHSDVPMADARSIALASGLTLRDHPALLARSFRQWLGR